MQKACFFLMIIFKISTFASENRCRAVIPCRHTRSDSNSFKWFYKKNEHSDKLKIFFQNKNGLQHHNAFHRRGSVSLDRSLVISSFTEDDQGLYWCENCYEDKCNREQSVIRVTKEILNETHETVYMAAGRTFTYSCPGEFNNFKWTFDTSDTAAVRNSKKRTQIDFVTSNKSIHIVNVTRADAGKYTCWTSRCNGHTQKLLTINLCVITDFSDIRHKGMSNNDTDLRTISVHVEPYGSLNCSPKQMFDAYCTLNSTHAPSNASGKTTGTNTQAEYLTSVIYGTSVALTCLILIALLIFYFKRRLRADISDSPSCCYTDDRMEEESSVVYSSVMIRRPAKTTNNHIIDSDCVYGEIKV